MSRTLATFAQPGSFISAAGSPGEILVGRKVANTSFIKALLHYGDFDRYCFLVGENGDLEGIKALLAGHDPATVDRIEVRNVIELPEAMARGEINVLHQYSHADHMGAVLNLRNRYAQSSLPVTAQIHSLSYPSMMNSYLDTALARPSEIDAVFCSSAPGREVVLRCFAALTQQLKEAGLELPQPRWELPVVPLGISCEELAKGDRTTARSQLGIPTDSFVVLGMARFTEFDKMDMFPVLTAFASFNESVKEQGIKPTLLLAGARQGTRTPEMIELWARGLGLSEQIILRVDFAEQEKAGLLAASDLFIAPSDNPQETFGITVVEAMAANLPIIAADFNGYKDTVSEDVGIRVPTHWNADMDRISELGPILYQRPLHLFLGQSIEVDLNALAEAMTELCLNHSKRSEMATAAGRRARKLYDWSQVIPRYQATWDALIEKPFQAEPQRRHPLRMDFQQVFGHYPTTVRKTQRRLNRSALAAAICPQQNGYPIYPEMKNLFDGNAVMAALAFAAETVELDALEAKIKEQVYPHSPWRASLLVSWLLKHGLLEGADC
ncbi:MAG: hypothetical protein CMP23_16205 [Rickettsiales bacterium]|nr:hypothetical protein [Rickettsiales bacterium]